MMRELECSECPFVTSLKDVLQNVPNLTHLNISMSRFGEMELSSETIKELNVLHMQDANFDKLVLPNLQRITINASQWDALRRFPRLGHVTRTRRVTGKRRWLAGSYEKWLCCEAGG